MDKVRRTLIMAAFAFVCTSFAWQGDRQLRARGRQSSSGFPAWFEKYANFHAVSLRENRNSQKFLVYACSKTCGGVGDRISGMISAFYVAVALNRVFFIKHEQPFQLNLTLKPNHINWKFEGLALHPRAVERTINMIDATRKEKVNEISRAHIADVDVIYLHVNRYSLGMCTWLSSKSVASRGLCGSMYQIHSKDAVSRKLNLQLASSSLHFAFHALFEFTEIAKDRFESVARELSLFDDNNKIIPYVALHARIGGDTSTSRRNIGWSDPPRHSLSDAKTFVSCAASIVDRKHLVHVARETPIVVITDNDNFKKMAAKFDGRVRSSQITLFHPDKSKYSTKGTDLLQQATTDLFADLMLLSRAAYLVGSQSSFSGLASSIMSSFDHDADAHYRYAFQCDKLYRYWDSTECVLKHAIAENHTKGTIICADW